jgi:cell division septal protein FtsQ
MLYRQKHIKPKIRALKTKKKLFKRPIFWLAFLILLAIMLLCLALFLPQFQITKISVYGNQKTTSTDIEKAVWSKVNRIIFSGRMFQISTKSIFTADTSAIVKNLMQTFPGIESVALQKNLPRYLTVTINERKPYGVFCQEQADKSSQCFLLDKQGIIFEPLQGAWQNMITVTLPPSNTVAFLGQRIADKSIIDIVSKIQKNLKNNFQVDVMRAFLSNPLVLETSEHWQVYFDPDSDIDLQITKMNTLLKDQHLANTRKNLQYIYLQYKNRAYYK